MRNPREQTETDSFQFFYFLLFSCKSPFFQKQNKLHFHIMTLFPKARDIKVVRPIYGVELFDGETARFEVEISEDDVHGQWKLNGAVLSPSSVSALLHHKRLIGSTNTKPVYQ